MVDSSPEVFLNQVSGNYVCEDVVQSIWERTVHVFGEGLMICLPAIGDVCIQNTPLAQGQLEELLMKLQNETL